MKPNKLKISDKIGIISPSDPVKDSKLFELGIRRLKKLGFIIELSKNFNSTNPEEKADDLNSMFKDKRIKAIICAQGGDSAEQVLPFIDWNIIKNNPKIFMGLSDITVLLNAITSKSKLITFHGGDIVFGFGKNYSTYDKSNFLNMFVDNKTKVVKANGPRKTIRSGKSVGKLFGGNIRCLLKLDNTKLLPNFDYSILILEAFKIEKKELLEYLDRLKKLGVFDKIKGIIVGYIYGLQKENPDKEQMEDILLKFTKKYNFPILKINDFGHNCSNTIFPIGCKVELDADNKKITFIKDWVK